MFLTNTFAALELDSESKSSRLALIEHFNNEVQPVVRDFLARNPTGRQCGLKDPLSSFVDIVSFRTLHVLGTWSTIMI